MEKPINNFLAITPWVAVINQYINISSWYSLKGLYKEEFAFSFNWAKSQFVS
jgi:hypothetical protein